MNRLAIPMVVSAALAASACNKKATEETAQAPNAPIAATVEPSPGPAAVPTGDGPAPVGTYDTTKAPVSAVKLGAFPYLSLPTGYTEGSAETLDLARFPLWVGDHFVWIEGKVHQARIGTAEGKTFSKYELQRNIEDLVQQAGGKKIAETQLPSSMREKLNPDAQQVDTGLGDIIQYPAVTFLIHRADKDIWVHFNSGTNGGAWAVVETQPFVSSAKLLPG